MNRTQTARPVDVVVIDDEESIREGCRQVLESEGYLALVANDGAQGIRMVEENKPKLVLLDLRMPNVGGIEVLERLPRIDPRIVPIVITGYGTVDSAVASMKLGAFDFIAKPFNMDQLLDVVTRGMARHAEAPRPSRPALKLVPPPRELTEADVLLRGLEVLGQFYALGLGGDTLSNKLRALEDEARHHAGRAWAGSARRRRSSRSWWPTSRWSTGSSRSTSSRRTRSSRFCSRSRSASTGCRVT